MSPLAAFACGAITAACLVAAGFFGRFWSRTGDRLFGIFSLAFVLMAIERTALVFVNAKDETHTYVYLIRAVAFAMIVVGIIDKNRAGSSRTG